MKITIRNTLLPACLLLSLHSAASHAEWTGNIEGKQVLDGDNKGSVIRFEMQNRERPFDQSVYLDYGREDAGSRYAIGYEPKYWFGDQTYVFGAGSVSTSPISYIDQIRRVSAGLGIQLLDSNTQELSAQIGAGRTSTLYDSDSKFDGNTMDDDTNFVTLSGEQTISDFIKLALDLQYSVGDIAKTSNVVAGLKFRIPGGAIVYSYTLQNVESDIGETTENTGSALSFEYGF